ncbi:MAG: dihydrodipicolinate synthase family protein, partial [Candidatus Nanopelagicus sp.]
VDYQSFESLVKSITALGKKSVLFFGVASENIKLADDERYKLLEILLTHRSDSGMKVIASVADHSAELAVKRAKDYEKMGVDFINILPPTFFNPTPAQINHHISAILSSVKLPVIVQHLPQGGGVNDVGDLVQMSTNFDNLKMIKCEANPPDESIKRVSELSRNKVETLIGWGGIHWNSGAKAGAKGIQPGCSLTDLYLWAEQALVSNELAEFESRLSKFLPTITEWISTVEELVAAEKYVLATRGVIDSEYCRAPTVTLSQKVKDQAKVLIDLADNLSAMSI